MTRECSRERWGAAQARGRAAVPLCRCAAVPLCRCAAVPLCRCAAVPLCRLEHLYDTRGVVSRGEEGAHAGEAAIDARERGAAVCGG